MSILSFRSFTIAKLAFNSLLLVLILTGLTACTQGIKKSGSIPGDEPLLATAPLLKLLPSSETGITFRNYIHETFEQNVTVDINTSNGGGVAIFDANNDGLPDVYFVSTSAENKLYGRR
jgi:hypothetical protein